MSIGNKFHILCHRVQPHPTKHTQGYRYNMCKYIERFQVKSIPSDDVGQSFVKGPLSNMTAYRSV